MYQLQKNIENKIIIKKIIFKNLQKDSAKEERIKKIIECNKRRNETPGVGLYDLDNKNSLVYKINSKYNLL